MTRTFQERLAFLIDLDGDGAIRGFRQIGVDGEKNLQKIDERLDRTGTRLQAFGAGAIATSGLAARALFRMGQEAGDLGESISKVETVFGSASDEVLDFVEDANRIGLSDAAASDYVGTLGNLFVQLKINKDEAADLSTSIVELAADFASFNNLETAEVLDGISAAFRGEFDSIQRVLPTINAAEVANTALAETGKANAAALTEQEKALATYTILLRDAGPALGDFERTQDGAANQARIAAANFEDLRTEIGEAVLPVLTQLTGLTADVVGGLADFNDSTGGALAQLALVGTAGTAAVGGLSLVAGSALKARDNFKQLGQVLRGGDGAVSLLSRLNPVTLGLTTAVVAGGLAWKDYADRQAEARQRAENLTELLIETRSAVDGLTEGLAEDPLKPVLDTLNRLDISVDEVIPALEEGSTALRGLLTVRNQAQFDDLFGDEPEAAREFAQSLLDLRDAGELTGEEYGRLIFRLADVGDAFARSRADLQGQASDLLASAEATEDLTDATIASLRAQVDQATTAQEAERALRFVKAALDAVGATTEDAEAAAREYWQAQGEVADATDDATEAVDEFTEAVEEAADAVREAVDADLDYADQIDDTAEALDEYREKAEAARTATGNQADAQREAEQAERDAFRAILDTAEAYARSEGAAEGSAAAVGLQIESLRELRDGLAPGSPLRARITDYIRDLAGIPTDIGTGINLDTDEAQRQIRELNDAIDAMQRNAARGIRVGQGNSNQPQVR